ncbi:MAG TPA: OmpA family protein [Spirochaetota bacterium]|nr:OmpA family protein [Spirochaetota bacterium]HPR49778.1 OmpA family protein [Spirochaetota bacterium]
MINIKTLIFILNFIAIIFITSTSFPQQDLDRATIKNLGNVINTENDEFFPSITADGLTMVFNRRAKGETNSDIYISYYKDGTWSQPEPINEVNSPDNDETPFISSDGKTLVFASNRKGSLLPPVSFNNFQFYTEDLYVSYLVNGKWQTPLPIKGKVNTIENERAPSFSEDGKTLYFSRWPFDSIEESRIMMATLVDGEYTNISEMPYPINSSYSDYGFMPSRTRPGFYFSSNRRGGYGLWDIYFAHSEGDKIVEVINLGTAINTAGNELSLTELGDKILFCSNRDGGFGNFDIYEIFLPQKIVDLAKTGFLIHTISKKNGEVVITPLTIQFINPDKPDDKVEQKLHTDEKGELSIILPPGFSWIIVKTENPLYQNFPLEFKSVSGKITPVTIELNPIVIQAQPVQQFPNIYFDTNSTEIKMQYIPVLHDIIAVLRKKGNSRLLVTGYADRRGEHYHNIELSLRRSISVRDYLLSMGIEQNRIEVKGNGYRFPMFTPYGDESDQLCRRVEFKLFE